MVTMFKSSSVLRQTCVSLRPRRCGRVNFNLVRIILAGIYIIFMCVLLVNYMGPATGPDMNGPINLRRIEDKVLGRDPDKFVVQGESLVEFRHLSSQQAVPDLVRMFEAGFVETLGDGGRGVKLSGKERARADQLQRKWAFNKVASDKISLWRTLTDKRMPECQSINYSDNLPSSSVIIIFNNEALSALLRTVWSVLDRTPSHLLHEIILVDDASDQSEITDILPDYVKYRLPPKVGLIRTKSQLGLIRARLAGAEVASGDILIFLDSHCEATKGWLEPMAQRIKDDHTVVQIPLIDGIDANTISYYGGRSNLSIGVGGFTWSGHFAWETLPKSVEKSRKPTDPVRTVTMIGGLFAIQREYFWRIGGYDDGMFGWGGENLELSIRVWRCGGSMEIHPCSHVGHIFRTFHPYFIPEDSHGINTARMAEVWMDDLKRLYYIHRPDLVGKDIGDLTQRFAIKDRLKCKSFRWFLDHVYPQKYIMDEQAVAWGRVRNLANNGKELCIDHLQRDRAAWLTSYTLGQYPCHQVLRDSQYFTISEKGELRNEYMCGSVVSTVDPSGISKNRVKMTACTDDVAQQWEIDRHGHIRNLQANLCLDSLSGNLDLGGELDSESPELNKEVYSGNLDPGEELDSESPDHSKDLDSGSLGPGEDLVVTECKSVPTQTWTFEFYSEESKHLKPRTM